MKRAKVRTIYDNYDLWDTYSEEVKRWLIEEEEMRPEDIAEDTIWDEIHERDEMEWEIVNNEMTQFFEESNATWLAVGSVGRWNGRFDGGFIFTTFSGLLSQITKDCDYLRLMDMNGHLYVRCSHHDGTNEVEIKKITKAGEQLWQNWSYSDQKRYAYSERELHKKLFEHYTVLPNCAHKMFGYPLREFEERGE